jgi:hypothetical protein
MRVDHLCQRIRPTENSQNVGKSPKAQLKLNRPPTATLRFFDGSFLFGKRSISSITRNDIQLFLNSKAPTYSRSSIRAMRLVLQMTLSFAHLNGWIATYPCVKSRHHERRTKVEGSSVRR